MQFVSFPGFLLGILLHLTCFSFANPCDTNYIRKRADSIVEAKVGSFAFSRHFYKGQVVVTDSGFVQVWYTFELKLPYSESYHFAVFFDSNHTFYFHHDLAFVPAYLKEMKHLIF